MPKGGRHGDLSKKASRIYEALRRSRHYTKKQAAKIANAVAGRSKKGKRK